MQGRRRGLGRGGGAYKRRYAYRLRSQIRKRRARRYRPGFDRRVGFYGKPEVKFLDTLIAYEDINVTIQVDPILTIPRGNDQTNRIGRKINVTKVSWKGSIILSGTQNFINTTCTVKLMIVLDTQTNGLTFTANDLLTSNSILSFNNLSNSGRFKILYAKYITLKSAGGSGNEAIGITYGECDYWFNANINCNHTIEYDSSTNTGQVSTVKSNNMYVVTQATQPDLCDISSRVRVRFTDL